MLKVVTVSIQLCQQFEMTMRYGQIISMAGGPGAAKAPGAQEISACMEVHSGPFKGT